MIATTTVITATVPERARREACDSLFNEGGLVDQALADPQVRAEIRDGLPQREAVIQWLDLYHCDMSPWYTLLVMLRGATARIKTLHVYAVRQSGVVEVF